MSAEQRRASARLAARSLLAAGMAVDTVTLRSVAEHADMPLPTLTYAYGSIGDLLSDLDGEFQSAVAASQLEVGDGGLIHELRAMTDKYLDILSGDPANFEILRWQMLRVARGEILLTGGMSMLGCLQRIQQRCGESWALPIEELAAVTQLMISGMHMQFFIRGADHVAVRAWRNDCELMLHALADLAGLDQPITKSV